MKLVLTEFEAHELIRRQLNLPSTVIVEIDEEYSQPTEPESFRFTGERAILPSIVAAINSFSDYKSSQKIAAIKRLRELVPNLGLFVAKRMVEEWPSVEFHIKRYNVLPVNSELRDLDFERKY
jgi:hypothetical protein